jgi:hypothetical protein
VGGSEAAEAMRMKDAVNRPRQPILCDVFDEIKRGFLVL